MDVESRNVPKGDFIEQWCRLEDGSILFAMITDDPIEDMEGAVEEGYTDRVNWTLLVPGYMRYGEKTVPAYECGQYCTKAEWTVSDFAECNWGVRVAGFHPMDDPYELREAIECDEDWGLVAEFARRYPDLFSGFFTADGGLTFLSAD